MTQVVFIASPLIFVQVFWPFKARRTAGNRERKKKNGHRNKAKWIKTALNHFSMVRVFCVYSKKKFIAFHRNEMNSNNSKIKRKREEVWPDEKYNLMVRK